MAEPPFALALDVGGTFTDVILAERSGGRLWVTKTASSPRDPATGFFSESLFMERCISWEGPTAPPGEFILTTTARTSSLSP